MLTKEAIRHKNSPSDTDKSCNLYGAILLIHKHQPMVVYRNHQRHSRHGLHNTPVPDLGLGKKGQLPRAASDQNNLIFKSN